MKLLVKADDYGFTEGINLGIIKSHKDGIVTSTALMTNMPAAVHGVKLIKDYPALCLGQHTNFVIGRPVSDPKDVPSLVEADGNFISSKKSREKIAQGIDPIPNYEEAFKEAEAQTMKFYELTGRLPEYLEGHAIGSPTLAKVYNALAKKYGLVHVSHGDASLNYGITKAPVRAESIYPWYEKGLSPETFFTSGDSKVLEKEFALVVVHPGYLDKEIFDMSSFTKVRVWDIYAVTHPDTLKWVKDNNIELVSYRDIKKHITF